MSLPQISCIRCDSLNLDLQNDGTYECVDCRKKFRNHNEHSRFLNAPLSKTYQYFRDVKSYDKWYSQYCQRIDVVQQSSEELITKEFWNISLDRDTDHIIIEARYTFFPLEKICYEVIGEYAYGLKNCIFFEGEENKPMTIMDGDMLVLHIISHSPASEELYTQMLLYFKLQDTIYLEKKSVGHRVGQLCSRCKKGHLRPSGQKEITKTDTPERVVKKTDVIVEGFLCDYCGSRFENTVISMT